MINTNTCLIQSCCMILRKQIDGKDKAIQLWSCTLNRCKEDLYELIDSGSPIYMPFFLNCSS